MTSKKKSDTLAAKKAAVLGTTPKRRTPLVVSLACAVLLAAGLVWYFNAGSTKNAAGPAASLQSAGNTVSQPVSQFEDGKARFFEYKNGKITIRYFILKSSDGVLRAAFDACDVCWPAGKGYFQDGDVMVCRNCGRRFPSVSVNEIKGGCNPAPLERTIENGMIVIRIEDIVSGQGYFDLAGKA
jgi:uncharacterized membrane protein